MVFFMFQEHGISVRAACKALSLSRTVFNYRPDTNKDQPVIEELLRLVDKYPRYGFGKLFPLIRRQGHRWNHKRVHRVYCSLGLNIRRKGKKRLPNRCPEPLKVPECINQCWSADFMSDALWCGRRFRTFNVVDDFNREILSIDIDINLQARRVIRSLDRIALWRGYPAKLRVDNGPEWTSVLMAEWAETNGVTLEFIKPGKPMQNAFIERFNRTYRDEVLDMYIFRHLSEVRKTTEQWITEYNEQRPHDSLGTLTPREYMINNNKASDSTITWH
jgi:putative transposase